MNTTTTTSDYRQFDVIDFYRFRADGDYRNADPIVSGLVLEVGPVHLKVAYTEPNRHYPGLGASKIIYLDPTGIRMTRTARFDG